MRLIDADALEKALHNFFDGKVIDEPAYILRDVFCHIDNAPTVEPTKVEHKAYNEGFKDGVDQGIKLSERPHGEPVIKCKDCKHQKKYFHEDKRMKEGGYWVYECDFICDPFESTPVCGEPEEYCSSAEKKGGAE